MRIFLLTFLFLTACKPTQAQTSLEISNFKSGLTCWATHPPVQSEGSICHETAQVIITGQGRCVLAGEVKPCTWHGFSFDYKNASEADEIECTVRSDIPVSYGTPEKHEEQDTQEPVEYAFGLESKEGHFFNPQYSVFAAMNEANITNFETRCTHEGKELFKFKMRTILPATN